MRSSAASTADGFYSIGVTASDAANGRSASAWATYVAMSSLEASVWADKPTYSGQTTVTITTSVHANGAAVAGASVSVAVTKPNGSVMNQTATTDANGMLLIAEIDDDQTLEAMRLGVAAVVLKEMAPHLLIECIRKVHAGERWVERKSVGRALDTLLRREAGLRDLRQTLTNREFDIVRMIVLGLRNAEIADRLSVSEGTVKSHLHHVYEKLGVKSRMALMLLAQQKGLK